MTARTAGYRAGLQDARDGLTPCHSKTAYAFPREARAEDQHEYNAGYYEAKQDIARAIEANEHWYAQQCARCAGTQGRHESGCKEAAV